MPEKTIEPWKITEARSRRTHAIAAAFQEWQALANQHKYPRSLVDIIRTALEREYELGRKRGRSEAR
jgi:hypothetical protein